MDEIHETRMRIARSRIDEIANRERHYKRVSGVFGTDDGIKIVEWLLDITEYWTNIGDDRSVGKYEVGRVIVDHICMADTDIFNEVLSRRKHAAEAELEQEKARLHQTLEET